MTARTVALSAADRLAELADVRLGGDWTDVHEAELYTLAHIPGRSRAATWAAWEEYTRLVDLRDSVADDGARWREVDPDITGPEPSSVAYEIACHQVEDAACVLLGGCS
jgi:hypothetical protein